MRAYGVLSEKFDVNRGVRQGRILVPALFNIFLDQAFRLALEQSDGSVTIRYSIDGEVTTATLNRPDEVEELILSLLYADDMSILCDDKGDLERTVTHLEDVLPRWCTCLDISPEKTEVMTMDRHGRVGLPQINAFRGRALKNVEEFKYLGTYFTNRPTERTPKVNKNPNGKKKKKRAAKKSPPKKRSFLTRNFEHPCSDAKKCQSETRP